MARPGLSFRSARPPLPGAGDPDRRGGPRHAPPLGLPPRNGRSSPNSGCHNHDRRLRLSLRGARPHARGLPRSEAPPAVSPPPHVLGCDAIFRRSGFPEPNLSLARVLMSVVRLIPLGVGGAFTAHYYTTCMALGLDDDWLLIECPHPIRKLLRDASLACGIPLDLDRVRGVALSHLHADRQLGDGGWSDFTPRPPTAAVVVHPRSASAALGRAARRRHGRAPALGGATRHRSRKKLDDYFDLLPLKTDGGQARPVRDRVPTDDSSDSHHGLSHHGWRTDPGLQRRHGLRPHPHRLAGPGRPDCARGQR